MTGLQYIRTAERPDLKFWLEDDAGALVNFTSGYTFTFKIGDKSADALFAKTTGITGAAGSGTQTSGTPNVTISLAADELDDVPAGGYTWQIIATTGGLDRIYQGDIEIVDVIL